MTDAAETTTETITPPADTLLTEPPASLDFSKGKPEGFPDDFWDAEKKAPAVDKLFKEFQNRDKIAKDLRVKLGKGEFTGKPPEDIKEYVVEMSDDLKKLVPENDPMMEAAKKAAKEAGLPKEAFAKFMSPVLATLAEMNADMTKPLSEEEISANRTAEIEKLGPSGHKIVEAVGSYIKELEARGTLSQAEAETARSMANTADAVRVLNKLRMANGGRDQVAIEVPIDTKASRMDVENKMAKAMLENNQAEYLKYSAMLAKMNNG